MGRRPASPKRSYRFKVAGAQAGAALGPTDRSRPQSCHGGNLAGLEQHIDDLRGLGVTTIWLGPTDDNGELALHGYHSIDDDKVEAHYGDLAALRHLVQAAHAHGLKVLQDQVLNHTGPHHPWVKDEPEPDWFHGAWQQHIAANFQFSRLVNPHAGAVFDFPQIRGMHWRPVGSAVLASHAVIASPTAVTLLVAAP